MTQKVVIRQEKVKIQHAPNETSQLQSSVAEGEPRSSSQADPVAVQNGLRAGFEDYSQG